ncbi:hypothetical protein Bbelb_341030 [Branchiostoma belcheri]|nr:hypothetical protein Bbelb_341030 [Branchiostoma belcheri]
MGADSQDSGTFSAAFARSGEAGMTNGRSAGRPGGKTLPGSAPPPPVSVAPSSFPWLSHAACYGGVAGSLPRTIIRSGRGVFNHNERRGLQAIALYELASLRSIAASVQAEVTFPNRGPAGQSCGTKTGGDIIPVEPDLGSDFLQQAAIYDKCRPGRGRNTIVAN